MPLEQLTVLWAARILGINQVDAKKLLEGGVAAD